MSLPLVVEFTRRNMGNLDIWGDRYHGVENLPIVTTRKVTLVRAREPLRISSIGEETQNNDYISEHANELTN
jgi:hypothetical protein